MGQGRKGACREDARGLDGGWAGKEQAAWTNEWAGTDEEPLREEQVWREGGGQKQKKLGRRPQRGGRTVGNRHTRDGERERRKRAGRVDTVSTCKVDGNVVPMQCRVMCTTHSVKELGLLRCCPGGFCIVAKRWAQTFRSGHGKMQSQHGRLVQGSVIRTQEAAMAKTLRGQRQATNCRNCCCNSTSGVLSAKNICCIAWWTTHSGAQGIITELALRPSTAASGHFQRKVDKTSGINFRNHYHYLVRVPSHCKYDASRTTHDFPLRLPREAICAEINADPSIIPR